MITPLAVTRITHSCHLMEIGEYPDKAVPLIVCALIVCVPVAPRVRKHGFTNVSALAP